MTGLTLRPWIGADRALTELDAALTAAAAAPSSPGAWADHVEIFLTSRVGHHTRFAGDRIHQSQAIVECQAMVRAVVGVGSARVSVSDPARLTMALRAAAELARQRDGSLAASFSRGAATPVASAAVLPRVDGLWKYATQGWDDEARSAQAGRVMQAARRAGCDVSGVLTAAVTELAVVTTGGMRAHAAATEAGFALTARSGDASSYAADIGRDSDRLDVEEHADAAIAQARRAGPLQPVSDGVHDVVFGGLATGELIGFVPDVGFTAPAVSAGLGPLAARSTAAIAAPEVTVADDALADVGLPFPFDLEGTPKRRVVLIDAGLLHAAVSDLACAAATGGASTGHAHIARESSPAPVAANLVMTPGGATEADLIADVEHGIYVQRLWYNRLVDPESGTVTGTSRDGCFLIENGKLTSGLAGARFTESVLAALTRTDGIGDRLISQPVPNVWNGCASAPAIRVRGFRFGPRPAGGATKER